MGKAQRIDRVAARPDPMMWRADELMTLNEAAQLMWPGLISERSLRHAVKIGRLPISVIAGKYFTNRAALDQLSVCTAIVDERPAEVRTSDYEEDLATIRKLREQR
jgi:hypothetical protein